MVRVECWEYWGGYWIVCTETVRSETGPVIRRRLGSCQLPAGNQRELGGMDLLAFACEQALDIAYAVWDEGPAGSRSPNAASSWDSESLDGAAPLSMEGPTAHQGASD